MTLVVPQDGMTITRDVAFQPGAYVVPNGLVVGADDITIEGNGAVLVGADKRGRGLTINRRRNVTVRNLTVLGFYHGIWANACTELHIEGCRVALTHELPAPSVFLDVWLPREEAYGGGIFLSGVSDSTVVNNDLQHQQNGLLLYGCRRVEVRHNVASYNSGYGILLYESSDNRVEDNTADFCCRVYSAAPGQTEYHVGADAAGLVIMCNSSRNVVRRNRFRGSGDGVFLGGFHKDQVKVPCNDNLFEENDASFSPNIGFEATFSQRNVFRNNRAVGCAYGFWLGWSSETTVESNFIRDSRIAGVAIEHGHHNIIRDNRFEHNGEGIQLWVNRDAARGTATFKQFFPEGAETYETEIADNRFVGNRLAVHVWTERGEEYAGPRCHSLRVLRNTFHDNRIGILFERVRDSAIHGNTLYRNIEAGIKLVGCIGVSAEGNFL